MAPCSIRPPNYWRLPPDPAAPPGLRAAASTPAREQASSQMTNRLPAGWISPGCISRGSTDATGIDWICISPSPDCISPGYGYGIHTYLTASAPAIHHKSIHPVPCWLKVLCIASCSVFVFCLGVSRKHRLSRFRNDNGELDKPIRYHGFAHRYHRCPFAADFIHRPNHYILSHRATF